MVAIDTNVLVRLITGEPVEQAAEAKKIYDQAENRGLVVDRTVLAESLYVLRSNYRFSKQESLELLGDLLKSKAFAFIDKEVCNIMLHVLRSSSLSPEDACLVALVKTDRVDSVATFDVGIRKYLAKN